MISDVLTDAITQHFPGLVFEKNAPPDAIVVIPAAHPEIGRLMIFDDGEEATVYIEKITHYHVNPNDPNLTQDQVDQIVTKDVIVFVEELLQNRIVLWVGSLGQSGGWFHLKSIENRSQLEQEFAEEGKYYFWSGPISLAEIQTHFQDG